MLSRLSFYSCVSPHVLVDAKKNVKMKDSYCCFPFHWLIFCVSQGKSKSKMLRMSRRKQVKFIFLKFAMKSKRHESSVFSVCIIGFIAHEKPSRKNRDLLIFMYARKGFISMVFAFHLMVRGGKKTFALRFTFVMYSLAIKRRANWERGRKKLITFISAA